MTTVAPPALTTGWEPGLADADSLCLAWLRHWADQLDLFATAAGGTVVRDERFVLADHRRPAGFFSAAVLMQPPADPAGWHDLLSDLGVATSGARGAVHLWSLWPTPDLRSRGWELDGHPPLLVRPPRQPTADAGAAGAPGPEPVPVDDAASLAEWERVLVDGYPMRDLQPFRAGALLGPALLDDPRIRFLLTRDRDGVPVAASAQFVAHGLAGFATGVTLPSARRAGHWWRHARARLAAEPDLWHVGAFSDDSRPGAERLGFVPVLRHTLWHRER
ncbi:hypothetical protein OF117_16285 [Geodermatophilus sp. YIM 151500]|uniref:hypothetical protein n=1 Tax=Geodermatophilus sp. YIM 151500 TaxID=2984531 RepID=UPI0021E4CD4C|nr:hypothetical protein [Geodermatophilus sp. YIM 151500]MCV2490914.1 hypothetical protein [Geodermatophilus sp. YIM 151500]